MSKTKKRLVRKFNDTEEEQQQFQRVKKIIYTVFYNSHTPILVYYSIEDISITQNRRGKAETYSRNVHVFRNVV